jgi:hypothetical protein
MHARIKQAEVITAVIKKRRRLLEFVQSEIIFARSGDSQSTFVWRNPACEDQISSHRTFDFAS